MLAEFGSVTEAVAAAVAIQKAIALSNESASEERRMLFRIGINLGDVIERGGDLFGDGVNIAARLQSLAYPWHLHLKFCARTGAAKLRPSIRVSWRAIGQEHRATCRAYKILLERGSGSLSEACDPGEQKCVLGSDEFWNHLAMSSQFYPSIT